MFNVTVTAHNGSVPLSLNNLGEQAAHLVFDSAQTRPGDVVTLSRDGVCLKRRQTPDVEDDPRPIHIPAPEPFIP